MTGLLTIVSHHPASVRFLAHPKPEKSPLARWLLNGLSFSQIESPNAAATKERRPAANP